MDCNKDDGQDVKWENFNRNSLNNFVSNEVSQYILDEILAELKIPEEVRDTLKDYGVHTPALFVGKSKYWYKHEIGLNSAAILNLESLSHGTNTKWTHTCHQIGSRHTAKISAQ